MKFYHYVGSEQIKISVCDYPSGTIIDSLLGLKNWVTNSFNKKTNSSSVLVATFVIDVKQRLCLADRYSEHVACAGRQPVLSAGEMFFVWNKGALEISDITNQSTGYCPEIDSWHYVEAALNKIIVPYPAHFTVEFTFRRCCDCAQINIIKNDVFVCSVCNSILPEQWNL